MKYVIYEYEEGIKQLFEKYPNLKQYFDNLTLEKEYREEEIEKTYIFAFGSGEKSISNVVVR